MQKRNQIVSQPNKQHDSLVAIEGINVSRVGLTITGDISFEQWQDIGYTLSGMEVALRWSIGDWLNYGEFKYGETYAQASDVTGFDPSYLANLKYITGAIEISRRREELHLSHHQVVAPLTMPEQDAWLDHAVVNKLSTSELRDAIKQANNGQEPADFAPLQGESLEAAVISYIHGLEANKKEIYEHAYQLMKEIVKDKL